MKIIDLSSYVYDFIILQSERKNKNKKDFKNYYIGSSKSIDTDKNRMLVNHLQLQWWILIFFCWYDDWLSTEQWMLGAEVSWIFLKQEEEFLLHCDSFNIEHLMFKWSYQLTVWSCISMCVCVCRMMGECWYVGNVGK